MPVTLKQVVDHVAAMDELDRATVTGIVREVLAVVGLEVNPRNDEVYNPAPAPSRIPEDNSRYRRRRY